MNRNKKGHGWKSILLGLTLAALCVALIGCGREEPQKTIADKTTGQVTNDKQVTPTSENGNAQGSKTDPAGNSTVTPETPTNTAPETPTNTAPETPTVTPTKTPTNTPSDTPTKTPTVAPTNTPTVTPTTPPVLNGDGKLVVIDAGHQRKGNNDKEPDGPGSTTMKAKVSSGTTGHFTGIPEYELNLILAKKVETLLKERGYRVIMVRDTHDVDMSNRERAEIANEAGADAFVRIHANAHDNEAVNGAETLCQTKNNPYNADLYSESRRLSAAILDALCAECGCKKRSVVETDTMSGINWCRVPVTIVEVGFMSNEKEDRLMATEEYRDRMAKGIADGIDAYFAEGK